MPERGVLVCQGCHQVWEPAQTGADDFAALATAGCPECGGWVWIGELVEAGSR